jgi:hypothetical protein
VHDIAAPPPPPRERLRAAVEDGAGRVRRQGRLILQTAFSAGGAWALALLLYPDSRPFFAPMAAVLTHTAAAGRHTRQAVELAIGVAAGIAIADLLVLGIGTGTLQLALVVALAMTVATAANAGTMFVNQTGISAILVVTLQPPTHGVTADRFVHALIGASVALLVGKVLLPRNPAEAMSAVARPLFERLAGVLEAIGSALSSGDVEAGERALLQARAIDLDPFVGEVAGAAETARMSRRRARPHVEQYAAAARHIDRAVRNTRVLARAAASSSRQGVAPDPDLPAAIEVLARAVRELEEALERSQALAGARQRAIEAARLATGVLERRHDVGSNLIGGQIRATATDLLRASGLDVEEARAALGPWPGLDAVG